MNGFLKNMLFFPKNAPNFISQVCFLTIHLHYFIIKLHITIMQVYITFIQVHYSII